MDSKIMHTFGLLVCVNFLTLLLQGYLYNLLDMFMELLDLEIVDFTDIPKWDNYESMYIPLFKDGECIIK